ncbi:MAG TPA: hypothetical protein VH575_12690 [Gemmataceae bacterium]
MEKYQGRPFVPLGVNVDERRETLQRTREKEDLNWRSWWDGKGGPIWLRWKVNSLPTLFLLDHKGDIRWKSVGVPPSLKRMDELIEQLVKEAEAEASEPAA